MRQYLLPLALTRLVQCALTGRFLTISDLHPDDNYVAGSSISHACHSGRPDGKHDKAKYYGSPVSDCDTPPSLIDLVFDELKAKWRNKVDFVVVMGDLARHDLDSNVPRTQDEIVLSNKHITERFQDAFGFDTPIVPSIGNNDVFPHNIMEAGPSKMISSIQKAWDEVISEEQYHTFARGGYYATEVIPGKLVVVALNTLFFFDSNKLMDGCPARQKHTPADPGTDELDWLQIQLGLWRRRNLQVIISGHVPPTDYWPQCKLKFAEIVLAFQDTIVGSVWGHKNVDHFTLFSHEDLFPDLDTMKRAHSTTLVDDLRSIYEEVPSDFSADDYAVMNYCPWALALSLVCHLKRVHSSVIPTYLPSYRIWTYNVSEPSHYKHNSSPDPTDLGQPDDLNRIQGITSPFALIVQRVSQRISSSFLADPGPFKKKKKRKPKKKKPGSMPRHVSRHSPSRKNRFLSLLGYEQYYLDLFHLPKRHKPPEFKLEYATFTRKRLAEQLVDDNSRLIADLPVSNLSTTQRVSAVEAFLAKEKPHLTPYGMQDLTIPSWLKLAHRLAQDKDLWSGFTDRIYVSALKKTAS